MKPRKHGKKRIEKVIKFIRSQVEIKGYFEFAEYAKVRTSRVCNPDIFGFEAAANCRAIVVDREKGIVKQYRRFRRTKIFHLYDTSRIGFLRLGVVGVDNHIDITAPYMELRDIRRSEDRLK